MNEIFSMEDKGGKSRVAGFITINRKIISRRKMITSWVVERSCKVTTETSLLFLATRKTFVRLALMVVNKHSGSECPRKQDSETKYLIAFWRNMALRGKVKIKWSLEGDKETRWKMLKEKKKAKVQKRADTLNLRKVPKEMDICD